jgi:hypothetical protein
LEKCWEDSKKNGKHLFQKQFKEKRTLGEKLGKKKGRLSRG